MGRSRWDVTAAPGRRPAPRVENLALVPASLLPHKATYQRLANQLPAGAVLVVLPTEDSPERRSLQEAAIRLRAKGHAIATLSVDEVLAQAGRRRAARPLTAASLTEPLPAPPLAPTEPTVAPVPVAAAIPAGDEVPAFARELRLIRINAGSAPARFEVYQWQPTLWNGVALVRCQGVLGQPPRRRTLWDAAAPQLDARLTALLHRRLQAGYRIADWQ